MVVDFNCDTILREYVKIQLWIHWKNWRKY